MSTINYTKLQDLTPTGTDNDNITQKTNKTYSMMLKFLSGALIGTANYNDVYVHTDDDDHHFSTTTETKTNTTEDQRNYHNKGVPTLQYIAKKIAKLEKTQLGKKQYIAYEMIACTFLLGLVKDGLDSNTTLSTCLQQTVGSQSSIETTEIINRLKATGGKEQLLMFLTGPAGSGKSTAMRVAEQFSMIFCATVGVMWCEKMFLFTAYKGSAASLIGGLIISKAAYINQQKPLSSDDINEWKDVKILVIDEVIFMSDSVLMTLNNRLMDIGNRPTSFGGLSIIFVGDFCQLEPVCLKESELMFSSVSSMFWKKIINEIIILDNDHHFKEDQEYRKML
jgi:hypothetical protein